MKVLVSCEESQRVCTAFREKGHEAYSCDIIEPSGGHPEWHILGDALNLIHSNCKEFMTMDGVKHEHEKWELMIAHPPCTHLAVSGARHFDRKRKDGRQRDSIEFFSKFLDSDIDKIAVENPIGIIGGDYIKKWFPEYAYIQKPTQIIQPYQFGDRARKATCLWLKNLPCLVPSDIVDCGEIYKSKSGKNYSASASANWATQDGKILKWNDPETARARSKTFPGIAKAMAEQWG